MRREDYKRHNFQPQEEEPLLEYQVERSTYFGDYTAVVIVDSKGRTTITLYEGDPVIKAFWGLAEIAAEPIAARKIGRLTSVHHTITDMIVDYELPQYQKWMVEEMESHLDLDYAAELGKRRQRIKQQKEIEAEATATVYEPPTINDYLAAPELTEQQLREQQLQEVARRTGKDPESLKNLVQFRNRKTS